MPLHEKELSAGLTSHVANHQSNRSLPKNESNSARPTVIGIYGIPGSGSDTIVKLVPGGLAAFQETDTQDKTRWRGQAIDSIRKQSQGNGKVAVVTGHFMFWPEADKEGSAVYTNNDLATFTHILYLDIPVGTIEQRRWNDVSRPRPHTSVAHLLKWQQAEKTQLQALCREHGILFSILQSDKTVKSRALELLSDFRVHTEKYNEAQAPAKLDAVMASYRISPDTMLVIDGDRTLAAQDTGVSFWETLSDGGRDASEDPLKALFSGPMAYSYKAFRQAMLLYEDAVDVKTYDTICQHVASTVTLYPEFQSLLRLVARQENVGAIIVSCGLRRVWEKVIDKAGFSKSVSVIAGGRISDGFVVTADTKAAVVRRLQTLHHAHVWAFGDSPLDLKMLKTADNAVVVVGDELTRSKTMDTALLNAIDEGGLRARQVTLPRTASPRLDIHKLPVADLNGIEFISDLLRHPDHSAKFAIYHATNKSAAKLIATPMCDTVVAGPALRKAHREAGWYLSYEFLTHIIGVEDCPISHVLGHGATGSRLLDEQQTTIVAVMRAGEPMASGVSEAFPLAMYVHAKHPSDLTPHHIQGQSQIVLVDSVVNSGKTVIEFVQHIRSFGANIHVVVVAGVVQGECVSPSSVVYKTLEACGNVSLVALRISSTKFTGSDTTDTGNRLFNSTHIL
jgi:uracil phosphoribosyltransferase/phosphoserine phosphatase